MSMLVDIMYMTKHTDTAKSDGDRPALEIDPETLLKAELLLGTWDREGGMSYRELAAAIFALIELPRQVFREENEIDR